MNLRMLVGTLLALGVLIAAGCDGGVTAPRGPDEGPIDGPIDQGPVVGSIILELEADTLSVNETTRLELTVLSAEGDVLTDKVVTLLSSDEDIVTVSETGLVTAEGPGMARLTGRVDDVDATAVVYVRRAASISVAPSEATLAVDDTLKLAVTVLDVNGHPVASVARFFISRPGVVTRAIEHLISHPEFRAVGEGTVVITAEIEGLTASVDVEVRPSDVGSVTLLPDSLTVAVYDTARLTVIVRDTTGAVIANPRIVFSVKGLWAGTVDNTGLVTGLPGGCGVGTVVARYQGVNSNTVRITIGSPSGAGCWDY